MTIDPVYAKVPAVLDEILDGIRHVWRCEPPSLCQSFIVTRETMHDDVRTIYAWVPVHDPRTGPTEAPRSVAGADLVPECPTTAETPPAALRLTDAHAAIEEAINDVWTMSSEGVLSDHDASAAEDRFAAVAHLLVHLTDLLARVMADDPAAIVAAARWLETNRPEEVDG